jgi:hypothetical protein
MVFTVRQAGLPSPELSHAAPLIALGAEREIGSSPLCIVRLRHGHARGRGPLAAKGISCRGQDRPLSVRPATACDIRALRLHRLTGNHDDRGKDAPSLPELSTFRVGARGKYLGCSNEMVPKMGDNE